MRFTIPFVVIGLGVALTSRPVAAPQATPPAVASSTILGDLQLDWQRQKDILMKISDAMPEAKWEYKSTPAQRSYGEQVMHIAEANVDLLKLFGGNAKAPVFAPGSAKGKAQSLKALSDSFDYGAVVLKEQSDATLRQTVQISWLGPATRARVVWTLLAHTMDIYGQMAVYLRLNGIVPPASRGV